MVRSAIYPRAAKPSSAPLCKNGAHSTLRLHDRLDLIHPATIRVQEAGHERLPGAPFCLLLG